MKRFFAASLLLLPALSQGMVSRHSTRLLQLVTLRNTRACHDAQENRDYAKMMSALKNTDREIQTAQAILKSDINRCADILSHITAIELLKSHSYYTEKAEKRIQSYLLSQQATNELFDAVTNGSPDLYPKQVEALLRLIKKERRHAIDELDETIAQLGQQRGLLRREIAGHKAVKAWHAEQLDKLCALLKPLD